MAIVTPQQMDKSKLGRRSMIVMVRCLLNDWSSLKVHGGKKTDVEFGTRREPAPPFVSRREYVVLKTTRMRMPGIGGFLHNE